MALSEQHTTVASAPVATALTKHLQQSASTARSAAPPERDPAFAYMSLAIPASEDDAAVRSQYRPFLLPAGTQREDWVSGVELATVTKMSAHHLQATNSRIKVLVLYGSLRSRSYSRLLAYEVSRLLFRMGCDVRVYNPAGLPIKDDEQDGHPKVQELRNLSHWSDGHFWVSPEQHGTMTAVFKNQIDWIPLRTGSSLPTQSRTLGIAMVSGGMQSSFNTVNNLRILGRWMRMFTIANQATVPKAYTLFTDEDEEGVSRLMPGVVRDRLIDCVEEFVKYTIIMQAHFGLFSDRFSERPDIAADAQKVNGVD